MKKVQIEKFLTDAGISTIEGFIRFPYYCTLITMNGGNHYYDPSFEKISFEFLSENSGFIRIKEYVPFNRSENEIPLSKNENGDTILSLYEILGIAIKV